MAVGSGSARTAGLRLGTPAGRWVVLAAVLGSGMSLLDATVVNIALPAIAEDLDAGLGGLQWTVNGYTLTLASAILLGGALGDRFGRRRIFLIGTVWFALASLLCALAPTIEVLILARAAQGLGGALLTPGSLAIISASFDREHRGRAIGLWSGLGGVAAAIGPFVGGYLIDALSWRWIFLTNLPIALLILLVATRHVPESSDPDASPSLDLAGALAGALGLGATTYALIAAGERGPSPTVTLSAAVGLAALIAFVVIERRSTHPMVPTELFADRDFTVTNVVTFGIYGALGGVFFLLVLQLQIVSGYTPLVAGTALLPVTATMLVGSGSAGALSQRIGPRLPLTVGPFVCAAGLLLMLRIGPDGSYLGEVVPAVLVFGIGLTLTVAPLTTTVLASAAPRHAGVASGVNNAVARAAGLLAVAALPLAVGLDAGADATRFDEGFGLAMLLCAGLLVLAGLVSLLGIRGQAAGPQPEEPPLRGVHCAVDGPPVEPDHLDPGHLDPGHLDSGHLDPGDPAAAGP